MRLERIAAKGLKGLYLFPSGLAFDYDAIPPGLVAVAGGNGQGKTTFLELPIVGLWGSFPSRPENALVGSVDGHDAFIELEAAFEGHGTYRARVNVDGVDRATDALLQLVTPGGSATNLNDGKVSTFRQAIARELPPLALVLASAFAAPGRTGSFATLGKKERKDLFAALLGLDHYEQLATTARSVAAEYSRRLDQLSGQVDALRTLTHPAIQDELHQTGNRLQAELIDLDLRRPTLARELAEIDRRCTDLESQNARYLKAVVEHRLQTQRGDDLRRQIDQITVTVSTMASDEDAAVAATTRRRDQTLLRLDIEARLIPTAEDLDARLATAIANVNHQLAGDVAEKQRRIDNNRTHLLNRSETIRRAACAVSVSTGFIQKIEGQLADADAALAQQYAAEREAQHKVALVRDELRMRERDQATASLMDDVPCGGQAPYDACQFLQQAAAARARVAAAPVQSAQQKLDDAEAELGAIREASSRLHESMVDLRRRIGVQRAVIAEHSADAAGLAALDSAQTRVDELQAEIADLQRRQQNTCDRLASERVDAGGQADTKHAAVARERETAEAACVSETQALTSQFNDRRTALETQRGDVRRDLAAAEAQLASLVAVQTETAGAHEALVIAENLQRVARQEIAAADQQFARLEVEHRSFEQRRSEYRIRLHQREQIDAAIVQLKTDLIEWTALAKIFGRDGLPVLEIDAAGPGVSDLANDLLQACFGSRFTVQLITQEPKADGNGFKEVFDLRVYDAERGGDPRDLSDLSSGEQVIVDEALKSAIALFVNQRNVLPIRTCWRDETIGALDPDNALRYVAMLRRLRERGGFIHVFFISHNPEAVALADAQIVLANGQINVRYPPYATADSAA